MSKQALVVAVLLAGCTPSHLANLDATGSRGAATRRVASLHHDPQRILESVAWRMGIRLRPQISVPEIVFESETPLKGMQAAAERQWGFRPQVFANAYLAAENRIYLIDDANFYSKNNRTLDDALAHEFVHYLQARYLNDGFRSEWSEAEAISIQNWFRREHVASILTANAAGLGRHTR